MQFVCVGDAGCLYVNLRDIVGVIHNTGTMRLLLTGGHSVAVNQDRLPDVLDHLWIRSGNFNDGQKPWEKKEV